MPWKAGRLGAKCLRMAFDSETFTHSLEAQLAAPADRAVSRFVQPVLLSLLATLLVACGIIGGAAQLLLSQYVGA